MGCVIETTPNAGHKDARTTKRYINLPEEHQREAMARLDVFNAAATAKVESETPRNQAPPTKAKKSKKAA
jgi:hypothetical protein